MTIHQDPIGTRVIEMRWMKVAEAAEYARVTKERIRDWIKQGLLRPAVTRNKQDLLGRGASGYIIDARDVDAILETMKFDVSKINLERKDPLDLSKEEKQTVSAAVKAIRRRRDGSRAPSKTRKTSMGPIDAS